MFVWKTSGWKTWGKWARSEAFESCLTSFTSWRHHFQTEYARYENGRYVYRITRSEMCEYMVNFILKLKHLPEKVMMNSVLENFTILQVTSPKNDHQLPDKAHQLVWFFFFLLRSWWTAIRKKRCCASRTCSKCRRVNTAPNTISTNSSKTDWPLPPPSKNNCPNWQKKAQTSLSTRHVVILFAWEQWTSLWSLTRLKVLDSTQKYLMKSVFEPIDQSNLLISAYHLCQLTTE